MYWNTGFGFRFSGRTVLQQVPLTDELLVLNAALHLEGAHRLGEAPPGGADVPDQQQRAAV